MSHFFKKKNSFFNDNESECDFILKQFVPQLRTNNIVMNFSPASKASYPGSGVTLYDTSGKLNNGTLTNGPVFSEEYGGTIAVDGVNDYITVADASTIRAPIDKSISYNVWANIASFVDNDGILTKELGNIVGSAFHGFGLIMMTPGQKLRLNMWGSSTNGSYVTSGSVFTLNKWHMFTAVVNYNGGNDRKSKIYVDGALVLEAANTETSYNTSASLMIGRGAQTVILYSPQASFGDVHYYSRELTKNEILNNYNLTKSRYGL
jgi:hypothetical protein